MKIYFPDHFTKLTINSVADAICDLRPDVGYECPDGAAETLYYFDSTTLFCEELQYKGCGGNGNRFGNMTYCDTFCAVQGDVRPFGR